jgi:death-on-curing protein
MTVPVWISVELAEVLHDEQLALFGGGSGLRDRGLLESVIARPQNKYGYEPDGGLPALAASLAYGVIRNHPFVDGNKRTGLLCIRAFLFLNEHDFEPFPNEEVAIIQGVAAGEVSEAELADWIAANTTPRPEA